MIHRISEHECFRENYTTNGRGQPGSSTPSCGDPVHDVQMLAGVDSHAEGSPSPGGKRPRDSSRGGSFELASWTRLRRGIKVSYRMLALQILAPAVTFKLAI
jgi:hypothetical protein